jgi:hypothetical protein
VLSEFDFYVALGADIKKRPKDRRKARLSVTRDALQTFVAGKLVDDHKLSAFTSWMVKPDSVDFTLHAGGRVWRVLTEEGAAIEAAIMKQATALRDELDAKKAAAAAAVAAKREAEAAAAAAAAEEASRWLTLVELQAGEYGRCSRQPVDEGTKELWCAHASHCQPRPCAAW